MSVGKWTTPEWVGWLWLQGLTGRKMRYLFRLLLTAGIIGALVLLVGYTVFVDDGLALRLSAWPIA